MFKNKTHSGAKKRFTKLASGLIKHDKQNRRHLLTKKTSKNKRNLRRAGYLSARDVHHIASYL
jgi:large subunit ribosomal protein L35